jgi:hypothetical protein
MKSGRILLASSFVSLFALAAFQAAKDERVVLGSGAHTAASSWTEKTACT